MVPAQHALVAVADQLAEGAVPVLREARERARVAGHEDVDVAAGPDPVGAAVGAVADQVAGAGDRSGAVEDPGPARVAAALPAGAVAVVGGTTAAAGCAQAEVAAPGAGERGALSGGEAAAGVDGLAVERGDEGGERLPWGWQRRAGREQGDVEAWGHGPERIAEAMIPGNCCRLAGRGGDVRFLTVVPRDRSRWYATAQREAAIAASERQFSLHRLVAEVTQPCAERVEGERQRVGLLDRPGGVRGVQHPR